MARIINGSLFVSSFDSTGNPGEWIITGAIYTNVTDATGNGAYDLQVGFLLYTPASDINTFMVVPGVVHRYKITQLEVVDSSTINATILWDEGGDEVDAPTNGALSIISEPGAGLELGLPVSAAIYADILPGTDLGVVAADRHVKFQSSASTSYQESLGTGNGSTTAFSLAHTPSSTSAVLVFRNGLLVTQGEGSDQYSVSGTTVTFNTAPAAGQTVNAWYTA